MLLNTKALEKTLYKEVALAAGLGCAQGGRGKAELPSRCSSFEIIKNREPQTLFEPSR